MVPKHEFIICYAIRMDFILILFLLCGAVMIWRDTFDGNSHKINVFIHHIQYALRE